MANWETAPRRFSVYSRDGQRVFRFEPVVELFEDGTITRQASISLHEDDEEIWRVDDFRYNAFESNFVFSNDLTHFAFFYPDTHVHALAFYTNGRLTRRYRDDELVLNLDRAAITSDGFQWENHTGRVFEPAIYELTVVSVDGLTHVFNISTGNLVIIETPETPIAIMGSAVNLILMFAIIGGGVSLVVMIDIMVSRKRKNQQDPTENDDTYRV